MARKPAALPMLDATLEDLEAPLLVRYLQDAYLRDRAVRGLLRELSEEEWRGVYDALSGPNQILFLDLYKKYRAEDALINSPRRK